VVASLAAALAAAVRAAGKAPSALIPGTKNLRCAIISPATPGIPAIAFPATLLYKWATPYKRGVCIPHPSKC
jgi:hypothetical protein